MYHDRVAKRFWCHKLPFYCILLTYGLWLCLLVLVWSPNKGIRHFCKIENERYWDQHHLATSGSRHLVPDCQPPGEALSPLLNRECDIEQKWSQAYQYIPIMLAVLRFENQQKIC